MAPLFGIMIICNNDLDENGRQMSISVLNGPFFLNPEAHIMWPPKIGLTITHTGLDDIMPADGGYHNGYIHSSIQASGRQR